MNLLDVKDLSVEIEGRADRRVQVSRNLNFSLEAGRVTGVIGESGSGKSMSALAVMGLLPRAARITSGEILFKGEDLLRKSPRALRAIRGKGIGMILQDPSVSLDPLYTIGDQIDEAIRIHTDMPKALRQARAVELLNAVGIPSPEVRLKQYPHELSGGMLQRVVTAIAIALDPALLIADEPTTALDPTIQIQVLDLLAGLRDRLGVAILLITHDFGVAAHICDEIMVMYAGEIVESGPARDIFDAPAHPYTRALMEASGAPEGGHRLPTIEGSPPDLANIPKGCAFAARCDLADATCRTQAPPIRALGPRHRAACWHGTERPLATEAAI